MRICVSITVVALAALGCACAQTFPPEARDALDGTRAKILTTTHQLPKYTCQETIEREYFEAPGSRSATCARILAVDHPRLTLDATDRLRLDVAVADEGEINSWPSASRFDTRSIDQIVTTGPISTGTFGTLLIGVFEDPGTHFEYAGREIDGPRSVFLYRYSVPLAASHYEVKAGALWRRTPYSGTFEINAATARLARLTVDTDQLPRDSGMCQARTSIDYHYTLVGDGEFLLPVESQLETVRLDGSRTRSPPPFPTATSTPPNRPSVSTTMKPIRRRESPRPRARPSRCRRESCLC